MTNSYVLDDYGPARRVLSFVTDTPDRIGRVSVPRNTALGIQQHMVYSDDYPMADTSIEAVVALLAELTENGLLERLENSTYRVTEYGGKALGGVVYADEVAAKRMKFDKKTGEHHPVGA